MINAGMQKMIFVSKDSFILKNELTVLITSFIQICGDIGSWIIALKLFISKKTHKNLKLFYFLILISFLAMTIDDIYYNYMYRIMHYNIRNSTGFIVTITFICFQTSQLYNWLLFISRKKIKIISQQNISYLLCTAFVIYVLFYFFYSNQNYPTYIVFIQSIEVMFDMVIWLFAIICFANTTSKAITLLTLGCLLIISADLTTRCLYIFEPKELAYTAWVHVIWTAGVIIILSGLLKCLNGDKFSFTSQNSLQAASTARMVLISFIAFFSGVFFLTLFRLNTDINMHTILWGLPIVLMFVLIISIFLAKKFSSFLVKPINQILERVNFFDSGKTPEGNGINSKIDELNILGNFINSTIEKLTTQLDREMRIAAQVSHDIRSPLSALQILTEQHLVNLEESKRILLRDAVYQIRDIVNNLDQNSLSKNTETQLAVVLDYVISERRTTYSNRSININYHLSNDAYNFFIKATSSNIKRVITNLINNSVEAIKSTNGIINITLFSRDKNIILTIEDNGSGIPSSDFNYLFIRGFTTKKIGSGLGLFHAKEIISKLGGEINIQSTEGKGTLISIKIPAHKPPSWFATELLIPSDSIIVCVDDSISILNSWQERLRLLNSPLELRYCSNKQELLIELGKEEEKSKIYLVDYEFSGQPYNGLNLIKKISDHKKPEDRYLLVTSRADEEIHELCIQNHLQIISKFFALKIPVKII